MEFQNNAYKKVISCTTCITLFSDSECTVHVVVTEDTKPFQIWEKFECIQQNRSGLIVVILSLLWVN